jgi:hypothetical protein
MPLTGGTRWRNPNATTKPSGALERYHGRTNITSNGQRRFRVYADQIYIRANNPQIKVPIGIK